MENNPPNENTFDKIFNIVMHAKRGFLLEKRYLRSRYVIGKFQLINLSMDKKYIERLIKENLYKYFYQKIDELTDISIRKTDDGLEYGAHLLICKPQELRELVNYIVSTLTDEQIVQIRKEAGK